MALDNLIEEAKVAEGEAKAATETAVSNLKVLLANRLDDVILLAAGVLLILFGHAL